MWRCRSRDRGRSAYTSRRQARSLPTASFEAGLPVAVTEDEQANAAALKSATGGVGAHLSFDQVGGATDPTSTLAVLRSLRRGGRMVLMGSMTAPLPIAYGEFMVNDWELIGNFMYRPSVFETLISLVRSGLLDLSSVKIRGFAMDELPGAMNAAARMRGLDCTVLNVKAT